MENYRDQLDKNLDSKSNWLGYLNEPAEMLAHAFEIKFDRGAVIADRFSDNVLMMYPAPVEIKAQDAYWRDFFKSQAENWARISPPPVAQVQPKNQIESPPADVKKLRTLGQVMGAAKINVNHSPQKLPLAARSVNRMT